MKLAADMPDFSKSQEIVQDIITSHLERVSSMLEEYTRLFSKPPIKGELTAGKLRWRGIRMVSQIDNDIIRYWVEQRGEKISPTLFISNMK